MSNTGNLFELATQELLNEINTGKRKNFTGIDIINYAIKIRKWLDKYGKRGINTKRIVGKREWRRQRYLRTGK